MKHFEGSRTRIGWADVDTAEFERREQIFSKRTEMLSVVEPESDGIYEIHKLIRKKPVPDILTQRAISTAENLRAALDLAIVEVGSLAKLSNLESLSFPFCATDKDLTGRIEECCAGIPQEVKTLLISY